MTHDGVDPLPDGPEGHDPAEEGNQPGEGASFPIVGVGASAGGLEAFTQLLKALPSDTGMGFVLVQHLAPTHASALALAESFVPDVVLLDIGMPGMDGYEVARKIREMPALKKTELVAHTGWGQEEDLRRAEEAGFHHHLVKPVDLAKMKTLFSGLPGKREDAAP